MWRRKKKRKKKCGTCVEDKKRGKKKKRKENGITIFFLRKFQSMASTPDDISLSSDQDTNQFLV